ncbi:MAG: hypothetical protein QOJ99_238 [Bryobacterales bacterium]|jgi:hypothetical protein|nr:hypothetical protein [Bryobacterales bacterium]
MAAVLETATRVCDARNGLMRVCVEGRCATVLGGGSSRELLESASKMRASSNVEVFTFPP